MAIESATAKQERLKAELHGLISEAGISTEVKRAAEGPLTPLGITGEDVTSDEYFAHRHDYIRRKIRDAFFSVSDVDLRRRLIKCDRETSTALSDEISAEYEAEIARLRSDLAELRARKDQLPWVGAAVVAGLAVAIGYGFANLAGAIGGAVVGFFFGQGIVHQSKVNAAEAIAKIESAIAEKEREDAIRTREDAETPDNFCAEEELTGDRNGEFSCQSAYANVLQRLNAK